MKLLQNFVNDYNGKPGIGDTPENDGQCVGLVEVWLDNIGAPHIWGNACDLPANADPNAYTITTNPAPGDIGCFPAGWGGSPVGHTFIYVSASQVFEQNDHIGGGDGRCRLFYLDLNGATFIHPKVLDQPKPEENMAEILDQNRVDRLFHEMLDRAPTQDDINAWSGHATWDLITQIITSPEHEAVLARRAKAAADAVSLAVEVTAQQNKLAQLQAELAQAHPAPPVPISSTQTPAPALSQLTPWQKFLKFFGLYHV